MLEHVSKNEGKYALNKGFNGQKVVETFGMKAADLWEHLASVCVGVAVQYAGQEQVASGNKGDTSLLVSLYAVCADNNPDMQKAVEKMAQSWMGLQIFLKKGEDKGDPLISCELDKSRDREHVISTLAERIDKVAKEGFKKTFGQKKPKARKEYSTSSSNSSGDTSPGEVTEVQPEVQAMETTGFNDLFKVLAGDGEKLDSVSAMSPKLMDLIETLSQLPETTREQMLSSWITKADNALQKYVSDVAKAAATKEKKAA